MNWNENDPASGAMACLDCGRLLAIGVACPCIHDSEFNSYESETESWREQNLWSVRDGDRMTRHSGYL